MDREASDKELEKHLPTLKDNDFIKQKIKICIGEEAKHKLFEMLNADIGVSFLTNNGGVFYCNEIIFQTIYSLSVFNQITFNGLLLIGRYT